MPLSLCPSAAAAPRAPAASPPRAAAKPARRAVARAREAAGRQLATVAGAGIASIPAGVLGYLLVEDARMAIVFALLVAITLLSLLVEPTARRR